MLRALHAFRQRRRGSAKVDNSRWSVLHVITKLELGGAQLATLNEAEHSRFAKGQRFIAYGPGGMLDSDAQRLEGVEAHELPSLVREISPVRDMRALIDMVRLVRRLRRADPEARLLVHTHSSKAGIIGRLGAFLGGADAVVHTIHGFGHGHGQGDESHFKQSVLLAAERLAAEVTDGFTADSAANIRQGESDGLIDGQPATVVRCGIDLDALQRPTRSRAEVRAALGIAEDEPVILTLACLKSQKDPLCWAEVGRQVSLGRPDAVFLLAGDGELRPELERFINRYDLARNLRLLGWRRDIADLLHASDIFLLTSRWEGLPQALPQAMAAGLPIVATAVDGNPEAVEDGINGYLFPPGDAAGMGAAILRLIADPHLAATLGKAGQERAAAFSTEQMLEDLDAFYEQVTLGAKG